MRFNRVNVPSWFVTVSLSSIFFIALAAPTWGSPDSMGHGSPHGDSSYSKEGSTRHGYSHGGSRSSHHGMDSSGHGGHHSKGHMGYGGGHAGIGHGEHGSKHPGAHQSATEFIRHILKFKEGMSLTDQQEQRLRDLSTNYKKTRVKMQAEIELANIDLHELLRNEQSSLSDIETYLKKVHALKADLYLASIKTKRDAKAVLTEEQRSRMEKIHERIKSHGGSRGHGGSYSRPGKGKGKDDY